jgi:TRAP-type C4-dicarboxylate transport system permease small subunit
MAAKAPGGGGLRGWPAAVAKLVLAAILVLAMLDMLAGVVLRYVVVPVTDYFDWPSVSFFWVEEVGELALAWLTLLGAAVAVLERTHFALAVLTRRLSPARQRLVERVNHLLIAAFGALAAVFGWRLAMLNSMLVTPALEINLAFVYLSAVAGGGLIAVCGLGVALGVLRPRDVELPVVPE